MSERSGLCQKRTDRSKTVVTSSVPVEGGHLPCVSVKTESDIPKDKIFDCIKALKDVKLQAPVKIGQIVLPDVAGTGVNVLATKNIQAL